MARERHDLDQTARIAIKTAPQDHVRWLFPGMDADLDYSGWLDTQMIGFPGEPKRTCDTVAELASRSQSQPSWAAIMEVEARPRSTILDRLGEYQWRVYRRKRHGPHDRDRFQVVCALIVLTGRQRKLSLNMKLPGTNLGTKWSARVMNLSRQSAARTLTRIENGELGRGILPWVPLMAGGGDTKVTEAWGQLIRQESNEERKREWTGLTRVFADRAGNITEWNPILEKVMPEWKSKVIEGWREEGRNEGRSEGRITAKQETLVQLYQTMFKTTPSQDLTRIWEQTKDLPTLDRWIHAVVTEQSPEAFREVVLREGKPTP